METKPTSSVPSEKGIKKNDAFKKVKGEER